MLVDVECEVFVWFGFVYLFNVFDDMVFVVVDYLFFVGLV